MVLTGEFTCKHDRNNSGSDEWEGWGKWNKKEKVNDGIKKINSERWRSKKIQTESRLLKKYDEIEDFVYFICELAERWFVSRWIKEINV